MTSGSLANGLAFVSKNAELVLIHDAARPLIDERSLSSCIKEAKRCNAATLGVPVKATVKKVKGAVVKDTLDRSELWEIQTPQVFRRDLILKAYKKYRSTEATDDAMLVEKLGVGVHITLGSYNNIKITTPEDLIIAEALLKEKSQIQRYKIQNKSKSQNSK